MTDSSSSESSDGESDMFALKDDPVQITKTVGGGIQKIVVDDNSLLARRGYKIGEAINSGTFATVKHAELNDGKGALKKLAVKVIDRAKGSRQFVQKFLPRELYIWPDMHHPNIIQIQAVINIQDRTYLFMELAPNGTVIQHLQRIGAVEETLARKWLKQLIRALKYCHQKGVAHRDVKCDNLLLDEEMNIKLGDFGFSRFCVDPKSQRRLLSETYCGSAAYVAPEVIHGSPYNPLMADIWSAGVCLFVILNNAMPFDDTNVSKLYKDQTQGNWRFSSKVVNSLSSSVKRLITRMLEPNVCRRTTLDQVMASTWLKK